MIPAEALAVLQAWLPANDDPVRPLISLATVSAAGIPDSRGVLLTDYDERGFTFYTDVGSRKARDLAANPAAAFSIAWPERFLQLSVQGIAGRVSLVDANAAYAARSRYLQLLAWLNTADFTALPLAERQSQWTAFDAKNPEGTLTAPDGWVGYRLRPHRLTFWRGMPLTASQRTEYTLDAGSATWSRGVLPG